MNFINIVLTATIYVQTILFTIPVVYNYIITDNWNAAIPGLGDTTTQRVLMLGHILPGIMCMFLYPMQRLLNKSEHHVRHYFLGGFLVILAIMTTILGNLYIWLYSTIGSTFMSVSFCTGGIIFFLVAITVAISGYIYGKHKTNSSNYVLISVEDFDQEQPNKLQKLHYIFINLFGAYIYASLFYRQLYFIAYSFGYDPLTNTPAKYERPLDRSFQIIFYVLPLSLALIYALVRTSIRNYMKYLLLVYYIFIIVITIRLYVHEFTDDS